MIFNLSSDITSSWQHYQQEKINSNESISHNHFPVNFTLDMPPHGPGMTGACHSHDPEYPDDNWNLYSMIEVDTATALNTTRPNDTRGIFKPFAHRLDNEPELISQSDEEIIVSTQWI